LYLQCCDVISAVAEFMVRLIAYFRSLQCSVPSALCDVISVVAEFMASPSLQCIPCLPCCGMFYGDAGKTVGGHTPEMHTPEMHAGLW
jgi:hypothetical protein